MDRSDRVEVLSRHARGRREGSTADRSGVEIEGFPVHLRRGVFVDMDPARRSMTNALDRLASCSSNLKTAVDMLGHRLVHAEDRARSEDGLADAATKLIESRYSPLG